MSGVGTWSTVLAVIPLAATDGADSTDEITAWVRARLPEAAFVSAAHGITRAALAAGAQPASADLTANHDPGTGNPDTADAPAASTPAATPDGGNTTAAVNGDPDDDRLGGEDAQTTAVDASSAVS